jgi:hypothetical protein
MTPTVTPPMQHIDEYRLDHDLGYRFNYLAEFIGFGPEDVQTIHAAAAHLAPVVPQLVDAVYVKLFGYNATKRHFVSRQFGYEGPVPENVQTLTLEHELIKFRKGRLTKYLERLVTGDYDKKMVSYLDFVGKMHTLRAGSKELNVPLVQMNALMGFLSDTLLKTILGLSVNYATKARMAIAFNKLLWIQNDLIVRHYPA